MFALNGLDLWNNRVYVNVNVEVVIIVVVFGDYI